MTAAAGKHQLRRVAVHKGEAESDKRPVNVCPAERVHHGR